MTNTIIRSGGVDFQADHIDVAGDVVGRDKIVQHISNIINNVTERSLTAIEETDLARSLTAQQLKQSVTAYIERLRDRVTESTDVGGPYRGLLDYRLSDASIFFGRRQAIHDLLERLKRGPLTILHSESGAGKSSLLQAGISPHLIAAGHLPVRVRLYNFNPALKIKREIVANLSDLPQLAKSSLRDFLLQVGRALGMPTTLYVFLDQFEEFFTRLEATTRAAFIHELAECLDDESLNVRWVIALRSESFGNLADLRPLIRNPFENDYRLNRLTRAEAHEAIAEPVARQGVTFEDGLIDTLLDDLGKEEVAPPQVQLVCSALHEALPVGTRVITCQSYVEQHGAEGILREHLSRVLHRDLSADHRAIAQHVLEALITSDAHRILRARTELATEPTLRNVNNETLDQVLNQLVDSRLLRVEEIDDQPSCELAHDYLLNEIKLDPAVQARKAAQELLEQEVHTYQRYSTLLSDDKFAIIASRRNELVVNNDGQALLQKSEFAIRRRQRLIFGGIGLVVALVLVGFISILTAVGAQVAADESRKQQAISEAGVAAARSNLQRAFEMSGIVPIIGSPSTMVFDGTQLWVTTSGTHVRTDGTMTIDTTIQVINPATGLSSKVFYLDKLPVASVFDGKKLWIAISSSTVYQLDSITGATSEPIHVGEDIVQAIDPSTGIAGKPIQVGKEPSALTFDGKRIWVANRGANTVQAIDAFADTGIATIPVGDGPSALAFDGRYIWVANTRDNTIETIDASTRVLVGTPIQVDPGPFSLAFDGTHLWLASSHGNLQMIDPIARRPSKLITIGLISGLVFDGARLWATRADNTLQAIDPNSGIAGGAILVGSRPHTSGEVIPIGTRHLLAFDGKMLWVASDRDNIIQAVDPAKGDLGPPVPVGLNPTSMIFDGSKLWVANYSDRTVQAIDPETSKTDEPIQIDGPPRILGFDEAQIWILNGNGSVQTIDRKTHEVGKLIRVGSELVLFKIRENQFCVRGSDIALRPVDPVNCTGSIAIPLDNHQVAIDGERLWDIGDSFSNTVTAISIAKRTISEPINVGPNPVALAFDGKLLWIANQIGGTIQAIDPVSRKTIWLVSVGNTPSDLIFDGKQLWVANRLDDNVQAIDTASGKIRATIPVGRRPSVLAFDGKRVWVANSESNTVQYIVVHK